MFLASAWSEGSAAGVEGQACRNSVHCIGADVETHEHSDGAIRQGESPFVGNHSPSSLPPNRETWNLDRNFSKSVGGTVAVYVGTVVTALSFVGSCLAAPFLVPIFQLFLVPPILIAMAVGSIGSWCRTWWTTGLMWCSLLFLQVWHDLETNPFGYKSLYSTYILNNPPQGFRYDHSWEQLYHITIIPLTLGVAVLTHGWITERRRQRDEAKAPVFPESAAFRKYGQ
jgi:hypothetical protein